MFPNDLFAYRQTSPKPKWPFFFVVKFMSEDPTEEVLWDAGAVVGDFDENPIRGFAGGHP